MVAKQWNAYDRGEAAPTPYFGDYLKQAEAAQLLQSLPAAQRATLAHYSALNARQAQNDQFEHAVQLQKLKMAQEAAVAKNDPDKQGWTEVNNMEKAWGINPFEAVDYYDSDPNAAKTGVIKLPGRWQVDPVTQKEYFVPGQDRRISPIMIQRARQLRDTLLGQAPQRPLTLLESTERARQARLGMGARAAAPPAMNQGLAYPDMGEGVTSMGTTPMDPTAAARARLAELEAKGAWQPAPRTINRQGQPVNQNIPYTGPANYWGP